MTEVRNVNPRSRILRLEKLAGMAKTGKLHVIIFEPGQDRDEVQRKYYEENEIHGEDRVLTVIFIDNNWSSHEKR